MSGASAFIVVDLGFGDAGKGLLTDTLVRAKELPLVVRFNGGAQAGHNVVVGDRHHTFAQFGSGTFVPGVRTHLAEDVVVHPLALAVEAQRLARIGVKDAFERLSVNPGCRVTTPFQQASNRLRELSRGAGRHGSCGVGFGETVADASRRPELTIRFDDLVDPRRARDRLFAQRAEKQREWAHLWAQMRDEKADDSTISADAFDPTCAAMIRTELGVLADPHLSDRWLLAASDVARRVRRVHCDAMSAEVSKGVVLEGAQGVLLDERYGFHPHVTFSRTTFDGALAFLSVCRFEGSVERIGVIRSHVIRHGAGPLPTEDRRLSLDLSEPHNHDDRWQGSVRKGHFDAVLLDYALRACGGVDAFAITHLDAVRSMRVRRICEAYEDVDALALPGSIEEATALTRRLHRAKPRYSSFGADVFPEPALLERLAAFGAPVRYRSYGPTANDVVFDAFLAASAPIEDAKDVSE